jgi:hypothetical protein
VIDRRRAMVDRAQGSAPHHGVSWDLSYRRSRQGQPCCSWQRHELCEHAPPTGRLLHVVFSSAWQADNGDTLRQVIALVSRRGWSKLGENHDVGSCPLVKSRGVVAAETREKACYSVAMADALLLALGNRRMEGC